MVSEVKVQTAPTTPPSDGVPGGNVNIVLPDRANQFHGVAQWFHTNQHLQALGSSAGSFSTTRLPGP